MPQRVTTADSQPSGDFQPIGYAPRRRRWLLLTLALLVAVGGGSYWRWHHVRYKNFAVHDAGKVLRSSWIPPDAMAELVTKHRVRTVVNLCDAWEKVQDGRLEAQQAAVEAAGAQLIEIPFPSNATWHVDDVSFRALERLLDDPAAYPVWVHCWHGRERTVKALAIYDIHKRGLTAHESLELAEFWRNEHPWPIVAFAHVYETWHAAQRQQVARESATTPPAAPQR